VTRLAAEGLSVDVPAGWDARIFRRPTQSPETTHAVLHLANFALPVDAADYGDGAVQVMDAAAVLVCLVEFHPSSTGTALFASAGFPLPLSPADVSRTTLQRAVGGQGGIQRFFSVAGRAWSLYVVVGGIDGRHLLVPLANSVVSTIAVSRLPVSTP
jgi:hypothetical protein